MHLFIQVENTRHLLTDVDLKDGFFPCIGDHKQEVSVPPMEPAIWCKVLVLDSVLIDCEERIIRWTTQTNASDDADGGYQCIFSSTRVQALKARFKYQFISYLGMINNK